MLRISSSCKMFERRLVSICRRLVPVSLVLWALVSFSGRIQDRSPADDGDAQPFAFSNYSMCGQWRQGQDVVSRLTQRVKCRVLLGQLSQPITASSAVVPGPAKDDKSKFYLTHDLFNAVGLGNFMFMAAALLGLAESTGRKPLFFDHHHHMDIFERSFPMADDLGKEEQAVISLNGSPIQKSITINAAGIYNPGLRLKLDVRRNMTFGREPAILYSIRGYLQSWKFFDTIRPVILRQFTFKQAAYRRALERLRDAVNLYTVSTKVVPNTIIGIHVRRGDMMKPLMKQYGHVVAPAAYLQNVTTNLTENYRPALFVIVSNDMAYCKKIFRSSENVVFLDGNAPEVDMAILSLMDHLILTVGSFGWFGAYLSDARDIYYYQHWPFRGSKLDKEYKRKDYFLPSWKPAG